MKKIILIATVLFMVSACSNNSNPAGYVFKYSVKEGVLQNMPDSSCYGDSDVVIHNWRWIVKLNYSIEGEAYVLDYTGINNDLDHYPPTRTDSMNYDAKWKKSASVWGINVVLFKGYEKGTRYRIYYIP